MQDIIFYRFDGYEIKHIQEFYYLVTIVTV